MLTIKKLNIDPPIILSSLSGLSDFAFRTIARRFGCPFAFYEMFDANSLIHHNHKTEHIQMKTDPSDSPIGGQIVGNDPEKLLEAALILESKGVALIDVNAGCPVPKVVNNKSGAYFLKDTALLRSALERLARRLKVSLTLKMRIGWSEADQNASEVARIAEGCGAAAIFIHGRTVAQRYSGAVSYPSIRKVKESVKIPVIGSGDIFSGRLAQKMLDDTNCDGVVVARGALGNPWIFHELTQYLKDGSVTPRPHLTETVEVMLEHLDMVVDLHGEHRGVSRIKKHIAWYLSYLENLPGKKKLKNEIFTMKTKGEIREKLSEVLRLSTNSPGREAAQE